MPSVLWCCWLGGRKGIQPVKNLSGGMLVWLPVWSKVQTCIWPSWCHCHSLSHASVKSRLVLPFWYRLTWVVPEKGLLNGCVCVSVYRGCMVVSMIQLWCSEDAISSLALCTFHLNVNRTIVLHLLSHGQLLQFEIFDVQNVLLLNIIFKILSSEQSR